jgi:hypothetical protein
VTLRPLPTLVLLGAALATRADPPAPATSADLDGARALALGASRATPGGNEGIFLNAATLAARRRYELDTQFLQERLGSTRIRQWGQISVVDSETSAVTGGVAYTRMSLGTATGNLIHVAMAGPLGGGLYAGTTVKYLDLRSASGSVSAATADAGLYYQPTSLIGIGVAGYNLVPVGHVAEVPRAVGSGIAVGDDQRVRLSADWRRDLQRTGKASDLWAFGAEALLLDMFPARAGYVRDGTRGDTSWSVGTGVVSAQGLALDLAYRQSVTDPQDRTFAVALKIFVPLH